MVVPETNCVEKQFVWEDGVREANGFSILQRREVPQKDVFPGKIPDFPSCRPLRMGFLAPPLSFLT